MGPFAVVFLVAWFAGAAAWAQNGALEAAIQTQMKAFGAESVGIYFEDPGGKVFTYHANEIFHAASTMKVPVMMEVFRQVESGQLKLDQPVQIKNEFKSIIDGSPYALNQEDDEDKEIYKSTGQQIELRDLVQRMINVSSNLATNTVIQIVSATGVMKLMKDIGADDMTVLRGVEDEKAYEAGKNNTTSARALATCLKAILNPKLFQDSSRRAMLDILFSQHFKEGIPAGIHSNENGLRVANKDGWITKIHHDAAIIQDGAGRTWILVILARGIEEEAQGQKLVAALAGEIWSRKDAK